MAFFLLQLSKCNVLEQIYDFADKMMSILKFPNKPKTQLDI